jgi:hypothetical protein
MICGGHTAIVLCIIKRLRNLALSAALPMVFYFFTVGLRFAQTSVFERERERDSVRLT